MKKQNKSIILDYTELKKIVNAHKTLGHKIICTIGSWDMLHIGHLTRVQKPATYYTLTEKGRPKAVILSVAEFRSWKETVEVTRIFPQLEKDIKKDKK